MSDPSPAKRKSCTDSITISDVDQSAEWTRHPELYMPDGTIVLLTNGTLFRTYLSLLAKHSEVFRDMASFSGCQPPDAEIYDGCPLVRLTDDAHDLAYFLEMIMGLRQFHLKRPFSFPFAAAVLRLSTKYMASSLREHVIELFNCLIPKDFDGIRNTKSIMQVFEMDGPHPFDLILLFRESQLTRFLPWTFYMACKTVPYMLTDDGVSSRSVWETFIHINHDDFWNVLKGWLYLCRQAAEFRHITATTESSDCVSADCYGKLRDMWPSPDDGFEEKVQCDALEIWTLFRPLGDDYSDTDESLPCRACRKHWLRSEELYRRRLWDALPAIFSLPPWQELQ